MKIFRAGLVPYGNEACERFFSMSRLIFLHADAHAQPREYEQIGRASVSQCGPDGGIYTRGTWIALAEIARGGLP